MENSGDPTLDSPGVHLWITLDGDRGWRTDGNISCRYGPAIIWSDGQLEWFVNDELHRLDGPALILYDGSILYYVNNERYDTYLEYTIAVDNYRNNIR